MLITEHEGGGGDAGVMTRRKGRGGCTIGVRRGLGVFCVCMEFLFAKNCRDESWEGRLLVAMMCERKAQQKRERDVG